MNVSAKFEVNLKKIYKVWWLVQNTNIMAYANFWHDLIIIFHVRATHIFTNFDYEHIHPLWNGSLSKTFTSSYIWEV